MAPWGGLGTPCLKSPLEYISGGVPVMLKTDESIYIYIYILLMTLLVAFL